MMNPDTDHSLNNMAIMRMAYLIENDFAEFYKKASEKADSSEVKMLLSTLAEWENKHRELFYTAHQELIWKPTGANNTCSFLNNIFMSEAAHSLLLWQE